MGLILDDNVVDEVIIGGPAYVSNQLDGGDVIVEVNGRPGDLTVNLCLRTLSQMHLTLEGGSWQRAP